MKIFKRRRRRSIFFLKITRKRIRGHPGGEIWILEKNVWSKSCFFYWNLQNELPYVKIGQQTKKFLFFGLSQFSRLFLHKRAKQKAWVAGLIRKNYQKNYQVLFYTCISIISGCPQYTLYLTSPSKLRNNHIFQVFVGNGTNFCIVHKMFIVRDIAI